MGTDIHMYAEARSSPSAPWRLTSPRVESSWGDGFEYEHPYDQRCYSVFAILADVRNGSGFAGCDLGDGFTPIHLPRGLPDDMSEELRRATESADDEDVYASLGDHSFSWLTLAEIIAFDWTQVTVKRGVVSAAQFEKWAQYDRGEGLGPKGFSGGVMGSRVQIIPIAEMERLVKDATSEPYTPDDHLGYHARRQARLEALEHHYTRVEWREPYWRSASGFLAEVPWKLMRMGTPENVRIVFGFDS